MRGISKFILKFSNAENRSALKASAQTDFFAEWQKDLPVLTPHEQADLELMARRLAYHRAQGGLLEGTLTLLVAAPLLAITGFDDPPFQLRPDATIEISVSDGEETLRGRIDVLVLQDQLWLMVLESKKSTLPIRSAVPQALAYMMATPRSDIPLYGVLTNGDDVLFVKLAQQPQACLEPFRSIPSSVN